MYPTTGLNADHEIHINSKWYYSRHIRNLKNSNFQQFRVATVRTLIRLWISIQPEPA